MEVSEAGVDVFHGNGGADFRGETVFDGEDWDTCVGDVVLDDVVVDFEGEGYVASAMTVENCAARSWLGGGCVPASEKFVAVLIGKAG